MSIAAIIVAAGRGTRAGGPGAPKQWRSLGGRPVLERTVSCFQRADIARIIVVLHPDDMITGLKLFGGRVTLVAGGETRSGSVRNALESLDPKEISKVLIHDGARPFADPDLISRVINALDSAPAAAPAIPVTDALWRGAEASFPAPKHATLYRAQTPQGFALQPIVDAYRAADHAAGQLAADDVEIARAAGLPVTTVAGAEANFKITWAEDFARGEKLIERERKMDIRLGNGYDVHAFTEGDAVILCGVQVPHNKALLGHSDADVAMHALTDAIYGALAQGDIGRHFPPSDPQWKGAASDIFLRHAGGSCTRDGLCDFQCRCDHRLRTPEDRATCGRDDGSPRANPADRRHPCLRQSHHLGAAGLYRPRGRHCLHRHSNPDKRRVTC